MAKGSLRDAMPVVTAWIDDLRSTFGAAYIDKIIKAGMAGHPVFFASENGNTVGTPIVHGVRVGRDERGNSYLLDGPIPEPPSGKPLSMREQYYNRLKGQQ